MIDRKLKLLEEMELLVFFQKGVELGTENMWILYMLQQNLLNYLKCQLLCVNNVEAIYHDQGGRLKVEEA